MSQQASLVSRNTGQFLAAAQKAGLKVLAKFTPEQAAGIKRMMPWTMWDAVKRALHSVCGFDVLGSHSSVRNVCTEHFFEYDFGSFEVVEKGRVKTAHFLRVKSVQEVVKTTMKRLAATGELTIHSNLPHNCLWLILAGDKGGSSTKLMLVFLNAKKQHSVNTGQLLGLFQGCKDSREAIEIVFGPLYQQAEDVVRQVQQLQLPSPRPHLRQACLESAPQKPRRNNHGHRIAARRRRRQRAGKRGFKSFLKAITKTLDESSTTISDKCRICLREALVQAAPASEQSAEHSETETMYTEGKLTHGGDWEYLANIFGTSGPNGTHFCNQCLVKQSDMPKGKPHALTIFSRYDGSATNYELRTVAGMHADNEKFVESEVCRDRVNSYSNCEHKPLVSMDGDVEELQSCMPLHISLGTAEHFPGA